MFSPLLQQLCRDLAALPGIGPKSAQRMALHLLRHKRTQAERLAGSLLDAMQNIGYCQRCRTFTEESLCRICADPERDTHILCIVEGPADMLAIEQSGYFKGGYFVLHGNLSPMDGMEPEDLELHKLQQLVAAGTVEEMIVATSSGVEGEATAHYIRTLFQNTAVTFSRLAKGIPIGGELEFMDGHTLGLALSDRKPLSV